MPVACVHIQVLPEYREAFINATRENHAQSILEKGNLRFDFLELASDSNQFMLYEAYETEAAAKAHKETKHYQTWKTKVENMMAVPRKGIQYQLLAPLSNS